MDTRTLEVLFALGGIFFIYGVLASQIGEVVATLLASRARFLALGIRQLVGDKLGEKVLQHPLVRSMGNTYVGLPSYIPGGIFAKAMLDAYYNGAQPTPTADGNSPEEVDKRLQLVIKEQLDPDRQAEEERVEAWFNQAMDRLSGSYRRYAGRILLVVSFLLVVGTNADGLQLAQQLARAGSLRQESSELTRKMLDSCQVIEGRLECRGAGGEVASGAEGHALQALQWIQGAVIKPWNLGDVRRMNATDWLMKVLGLLLTTLAVSMGAPFWFDLLTRVAPGLRMVGRPPAANPPTSP